MDDETEITLEEIQFEMEELEKKEAEWELQQWVEDNCDFSEENEFDESLHMVWEDGQWVTKSRRNHDKV
jgi:hypothetical protein